MRQIRTLIERGWQIEIHMGADYCFYVLASHGTWGDAKGVSSDFNEAIKKMFIEAKVFEKDWR